DPRSTSKDAPSTARFPPNRFSRRSTTRIGSAIITRTSRAPAPWRREHTPHDAPDTPASHAAGICRPAVIRAPAESREPSAGGRPMSPENLCQCNPGLARHGVQQIEPTVFQVDGGVAELARPLADLTTDRGDEREVSTLVVTFGLEDGGDGARLPLHPVRSKVHGGGEDLLGRGRADVGVEDGERVALDEDGGVTHVRREERGALL